MILLRTCSGRSFEDRPDEALIRVLIDTGARLGEVAGVTVEDVDFDRWQIRIQRKAGRSSATREQRSTPCLVEHLLVIHSSSK
jgi:integrase